MDESVFYTLILTIVSLIILCVVLVFLYIKEIRSRKKESAQDIEQSVVEKAEKKSVKILEEAYSKARGIIASADEYLKREEGALAKALENAQNVYIRSYNDAIKASEERAERMIQNIPQDIKITLISVIDSFRLSLTDEIKRAQSEANKVVMDAYKESLASIERYKQERMKQVDDSILDIVKEVTKKVLSKTLTIEEHEKLVYKALEEAKRQKVI